jgi:uncharacterized damage-inducible protein DinB
MDTEILRTLFTRDLNRLKQEIESYTTNAKLWITAKNISNSGGNLCLHLIGNLNTYIGANLGGTGYIRNRDLEFSLKDLPKAELVRKIDDTLRIVDETLNKLSQQQLEEEYPFLVLEEMTSTGYLMTHLATHLTYHLGQINYHRRLLDS